MYRTKGILILCLFAVINTTNAEIKLVNAGEATKDDVDSLVHITSEQALPVILFATKESTNLQTLFGLTRAAIYDGRLITGTKFFTRSSAPQIFFCPHPNPPRGKRCLIRKHFEPLQNLQCDLEPMPSLKTYPGVRYCGAHQTGTFLMFTYEICPAEPPYSYNPQYARIYTLCYDRDAKKNLFAMYSMVGAALLSEDLLIREREIEFPMNTESYGMIDENYYAKLQAEIRKNTNYGLQTLVPIDDMPLATSRKATRYYANFALQHKNLIGLWNEIREHIRNHASKMNDEMLSFMTGVFDIPEDDIPTSLGKDQMATIWVTHFATSFADPPKVMVIVMNNFITKDSENEGKRGETSQQQQYIDKICHNKNLCARSLMEKFEEIGGEVRCCSLTEDIMNFFFAKHPIPPTMDALNIDNIIENS